MRGEELSRPRLLPGPDSVSGLSRGFPLLKIP